MKTYEAFIILKPILDVDNSDGVLKSIEDTIENLKGKVLKKDKMGRKRLAYEIRKFKDGFITTYLLALDPTQVDAFRRACQLNEDILRLMLINRNDVEIDALALNRDRSERPGERPMGDRGERGDRPDFRGDRERGDRPERPVRARVAE
jgi:small subunit ribosomal protein S6